MFDHSQTVAAFGKDDVLLSRYVLERVLGQGAQGAVWLARDTQLDRAVAIKMMPAVLCRDKRSIARLKDEAKRNLELTHPNIVRLYTFEQDPARGNVAFLVMQYVEGETLNDVLAEHPKGMPLERVRPWFEQVAAAIDFAHTKGVLHRDIKPANIMIEAKSGTAYLMDFGIASEIRDTMTQVTGALEASGTPAYMSPQQLNGKSDKSNDVYSFAATWYESLCGHPPFHKGDIVYQIRNTEPEPIEGLPAPVNAALALGLHKDSAKRPATCVLLLAARAVTNTPPPPPALRHLARKTVEFAPGVTAEFVYIDAPGVAPDGFVMGSPASEEGRSDDETQHRVKLTKGFWMQTTEVTQAQWLALMDSNPSNFTGDPRLPVEQVSWEDCQQFIARARARGIAARLPTEAEWEFACRAGTMTPFSFGATISTEQANYNGKYDAVTIYGTGREGVNREKTTPAGMFPANAWGLHDMHGNVWELVYDWYGQYPSGATLVDPIGPQAGRSRVMRGGSWVEIPKFLRSAFRNGLTPTDSGTAVGFRVCLDSN